jgi:hypothetical protein
MAEPWTASWVGQARPGDVGDTDPRRRAAAWAQWAATSLVEMDNGERSYPALLLPASFYDPHGNGPRATPHLEVPARVMRRPDPEFPQRLAQAGNGLRFQYWVYGEVVALRRSLFNCPPGPPGELFEVLDARAGGLRDGLAALSRYAGPNWPVVAAEIISDGLIDDACGDFSVADVASWLPAAEPFELEVRFDAQLREKNGTWASRRVGVWQIRGVTPGGDPFGFGVVTPRLTANSLFSDELFDPRRESLGAALVRSLVLRRIINARLGGGRLVRHRVGDPMPDHDSARPARPQGHLMAVAAKTGQKLPDAGVGAAVAFVTAYPDRDAAWEALTRWADRGFLLTVTREAFRSAHTNASRALRRAEEPDRNDVDCLLPLAWDNQEGKAQVVRVTWARPRGEGEHDS